MPTSVTADPPPARAAVLAHLESLPRSQATVALRQLEAAFGDHFWQTAPSNSLTTHATLFATRLLRSVGRVAESTATWEHLQPLPRARWEPATQALFLLISGERAFDDGHTATAETAAREAARLAAQAGRSDLQGFALLTLAGLAVRGGATETALRRFDEALLAFTTAGLWEAQAGCLNNLAVALHSIGRPDDALDALARCRRLADEHNDVPTHIRVLGNLALIHRNLGDHELALAHSEECLTRVLALGGNPLQEAYLHNGHGVSLFRLGRVEEAIACYEKSLRLKETQNRPAETASTLINLAHAYLRQGQTTEAENTLQRVEALLQQFTHREVEILVHLIRAELAARAPDEPTFRTALLHAHDLCSQHDLPRTRCELLNAFLEWVESHHLRPAFADAVAVALLGEPDPTPDRPLLSLAETAIRAAETAHCQDEHVRALRQGARLAAEAEDFATAWNWEHQAAALAATLHSEQSERRLRAIGLRHELEQSQAVAATERARRTELDHLNTQLRTLLRERDEILGIVAHDLRNPLGGLRTLCGLLQTLTGDPAHATALHASLVEMEASAAGLLAVTEGLLHLDRPDRDSDSPDAADPIDWSEVIRESIASYTSAARAKEIAIHFAPTGAVPPIPAARPLLRRIVDNLLSNALKFSPPAGHVLLSLGEQPATADAPHALVFEVTDTGPGLGGIDPICGVHPSPATSAQPTAGEPSTGLGLPAVKRTVERLGGTLRAVENPTGGATFIVSLPLPPRA